MNAIGAISWRTPTHLFLAQATPQTRRKKHVSGDEFPVSCAWLRSS
jgi:hypothetical protein